MVAAAASPQPVRSDVVVVVDDVLSVSVVVVVVVVELFGIHLRFPSRLKGGRAEAH